jgi:hypothetical protein
MDAWGIAVFGVAATLAGAVLNHWLSVGRMKREREAAVRERWREQALTVLGPVGRWLTDADPDRLGINASEEGSPAVFEALERRSDEMRDQIATLAVGFPTERGRDLAGELDVAIFNSLISAGWFVRDVLTHSMESHSSAVNQQERAKAEHAKAVETRNALAEEVRSLS